MRDEGWKWAVGPVYVSRGQVSGTSGLVAATTTRRHHPCAALALALLCSACVPLSLCALSLFPLVPLHSLTTILILSIFYSLLFLETVESLVAFHCSIVICHLPPVGLFRHGPSKAEASTIHRHPSLHSLGQQSSCPPFFLTPVALWTPLSPALSCPPPPLRVVFVDELAATGMPKHILIPLLLSL